MRVLILVTASLTACGYTPPPGVPLDWGQEWMPMVKLEIHESTCDGVERPLMSYVDVRINENFGRESVRGMHTVTWQARTSDTHERVAAAFCISAPEPTDEGYALDCPTREWMIARNPVNSFNHDYADWTRHGFFAGPSSVVLHHDLQVRDCHHLTECAEYTANCTMRYTTWFGDWDD